MRQELQHNNTCNWLAAAIIGYAESIGPQIGVIFSAHSLFSAGGQGRQTGTGEHERAWAGMGGQRRIE